MNNIKKFFKENWLMILAIIYLIWPFDIIPDIVPVAGQTDDAILLAIEMIRRWYVKRGEKTNTNKEITTQD